jgi:hypothetical protein
LFAWLSAWLAPASAHAQTKPFYEGKTVRVIVGPSGGYYYWARLLARTMPKYTETLSEKD